MITFTTTSKVLIYATYGLFVQSRIPGTSFTDIEKQPNGFTFTLHGRHCLFAYRALLQDIDDLGLQIPHRLEVTFNGIVDQD